MRISRDQKICGVSALALRRVFRLSGGVITESELTHRLKISLSRADALTKALLKEGYIAQQKTGTFGFIGWDLTVKGNALSLASAAKPMTRKTAERKIAEFLERVQQVRDDPRYLYKPTFRTLSGQFSVRNFKV